MTAPTINSKTWATLRARAALLGYILTRTFRTDSTEVTYQIEKHGLVRKRTAQELIEMLLEKTPK